jgi:hypothetical protein
MNTGLSDRIREVAGRRYVKPALSSGQRTFSIRVRDLLTDLQSEGFPPRHTPQICNALVTAKFLRENGLSIQKVDGPPSLQSPRVVVHYQVAHPEQVFQVLSPMTDTPNSEVPSQEDPSARALRLTERLRGILKEELAEYGGAEGFLRWIRSDDEEAA